MLLGKQIYFPMVIENLLLQTRLRLTNIAGEEVDTPHSDHGIQL